MKITGCTKTRGLLRSGNANHSSNTGSFILNSNNAPSNSNANHGSQLCYQKYVFVNPAHMAKKDNNTQMALVLKRKKTF